ncbi:MAG: hypothetical protein ABSG56_27890, partial [Bryobacteraceae bacterium]
MAEERRPARAAQRNGLQHKTAFSADVLGSRRQRLPKPLQPHREIESPPSNRMPQVRCNKMQNKNGFSDRAASSARRDAPRPKIFQKTAANHMIPSSLSEIGFVCSKKNLSPASPSATTSANHAALDPQCISPNRRFICVHPRPSAANTVFPNHPIPASPTPHCKVGTAGRPAPQIPQKIAANKMIPKALLEIGFVCSKKNLTPAMRNPAASRRFIGVHRRSSAAIINPP